MPARVVLHLPRRFHEGFAAKAHLALHGKIAAMVARRGGEVVLAPRSDEMLSGTTMEGDGDLHIVESGWCRGPGWLSAAVAYLPEFWHLDPDGVLADSAARFAVYDAAEAPADAAAFADGLRARYVGPRKSRYRQKVARTAVDPDAIVIFLQGRMPEWRGHAYLSTPDMLAAVVAAAGGRPVWVKPHPVTRDEGLKVILAAQDRGLSLVPTDGHVHDLLAGTAVSVSINSAIALEALLHRKGSVICGRADFAHLVTECRTADGMAAALARALTPPPDADARLAWYFQRHCLDLTDPALEDRLLERFAAAGFPADRLGLSA